MFDAIPYIPYNCCFGPQQSVANSRVFQSRIRELFSPFELGKLCSAMRTFHKVSLLNSFGAPSVWHFDCDCIGTRVAVWRPVMRKNRFWIEVITLCAGAAFGLALALAFVGAVVVAFGQTAEPPQSVVQPDRQQTYVGMVTCSRCFAKHSAKIGATATDCARVCIRDGANFTFINGDRTYRLEGDPAELKRVAGQRVQIVGALNGGTITVASVAAGT